MLPLLIEIHCLPGRRTVIATQDALLFLVLLLEDLPIKEVKCVVIGIVDLQGLSLEQRRLV